MKQKLFIIAAILVFTVSAAACSAKNEGSTSTAAVKTETTADADRTNDAGTAEADAADLSTGDSQEGEGTVTGVVEENKGFMITVVADDDEEAYVFTLDETQSEKYKDIKSGEKITVSYTNGLPTPDNLDTIVTDIQPAK